jgi:hypothetical protein
MKVKLIQAGGFMGRSKFAEEDLSDYDAEVKDHLDKVFLKTEGAPIDHLPSGSNNRTSSLVRDNLYYFIEYNGHRARIEDNASLPNELQRLFETLKERLEY